MLRINLQPNATFILQSLQLGLQFLQENHVVELYLIALLIQLKERSLIVVVSERGDSQRLVCPT